MGAPSFVFLRDRVAARLYGAMSHTAATAGNQIDRSCLGSCAFSLE